MCKLSPNIVPNVYNSLKSSFLSLAWPWQGRSLPKGNQWECWDPGLGPMWSGSQSTCLPQCTPDTPQSPQNPDTPYKPPMSPLIPEARHFLAAPQCTPCQPLYSPNTPYTPASAGILWSTVVLLQVSMTPPKELLHTKDLLPARVTI